MPFHLHMHAVCNSKKLSINFQVYCTVDHFTIKYECMDILFFKIAVFLERKLSCSQVLVLISLLTQF